MERAVVDLQRGRERWAREGYDISRTSATLGLNRDKIWSEDFVGYVRERLPVWRHKNICSFLRITECEFATLYLV